MFSIPAKWNKRFWYSCSAWNSAFPTVVWHRFRIRKYSLFFELEKWHTYRKHFSTGRHTAQLDIGDLNRTQFTELNLVRNSKTSSLGICRKPSKKGPFWQRKKKTVLAVLARVLGSLSLRGYIPKRSTVGRTFLAVRTPSQKRYVSYLAYVRKISDYPS